MVPGRRGALPITHETVGARLGDVDGDDLLDIVTVSHTSPFLWVAINTSSAAESVE